NFDVLELYNKHMLTLTRQVPCHPNGGCTVDMLFAVNGVPVATCELKNPATGQTWRHAVKQYKEDRDPRAPLFQLKSRALVHFAADPDEVPMTTRLEHGKTHFLPFNRGSHPGEVQCSKGNPQHPSGIGPVEKKEEKIDDGKDAKKRVVTETMVFPRYHQLDAVRKIVITARNEGPSYNYLIQHSAGSGKTNSISWLS